MALRDLTLWDGEIDKVAIAVERLREYEPPEGYYVAFSGGKDSTAALALVKLAGVKYEAHFHAHNVEPPEVVRFIRNDYPEVIRDHPPRSMWEVVRARGCLPTRMRPFCCQVFNEPHGQGRTIVTGVRWEESARRKKRRLYEACTYGHDTFFMNPVIDWTEAEIWELIRKHNVPYCKLYDQGCNRVGCIGCPMGRPKDDEVRWPKIMAQWKRVAVEVFEARKGGRRGKHYGKTKLRTMFDSGEQYYHWWVNQASMGVSIDQLRMVDGSGRVMPTEEQMAEVMDEEVEEDAGQEVSAPGGN